MSSACLPCMGVACDVGQVTEYGLGVCVVVAGMAKGLHAWGGVVL